MLDCGLSAQSVLNFLPLPLVHSSRLSNLPSWMPRDCMDSQLDGVSFLFVNKLKTTVIMIHIYLILFL